MIGATSIGLGRDVFDALASATGLDIDFLELTCEYPHCYPDTLSHESRQKIRSLAREGGLRLSVHSTFSDINLVHINPGLRLESLRQTAECLGFARDIGASHMVVHPGEIPQSARSLSPDALAQFGVQDARGYFHALARDVLSSLTGEIAVCVENMPEPHELCRTPEEHLSVLDGARACLDAGHATIAHDAVVHAETLKDKISYVHIHDNHGIWDEHLGLGEGVVPYEEVVGILGERMYCVEPVPFNRPSVQKSIALLREITS